MQQARRQSDLQGTSKPVPRGLDDTRAWDLAAKARDLRVADPDQASQIVRDSLRHLFHLIGANGRFIYAHARGAPDNPFDGYNMLRHCGTIWFMCTAIIELKVNISPWQASLLGRAVDYVRHRIKEPQWIDGGSPCLCLVTKDRVKLGGNGLALLMFRQFAKLQSLKSLNAPALSGVPATLTEGLENYIVSQATGSDFIHKRQFSDGKISSFRSDYYTGEALFGLFCRGTLADQVRPAATTLIQGGYGVDIQSHWMAYAVCEAVRHDILAPRLLADYLSSLITSILENDAYRTRRQSTPIACRSEALTVCLNTIRQSPALRRRISPELVAAAEQCAAENLSLQLHWYADGQFWKGDDENRVQIDYIQHNAASFLSWHTYMKDSGARLSILGQKGTRATPNLAPQRKNIRPIPVPSSVSEGVARPDFVDLTPNLYNCHVEITGQDLIDSAFAEQKFQVERYGVISRFSRNGRSVFTRGAETSFTSWLGSKVLKQKELGKQLMTRAGARTAEGRVFGKGEAEKALHYVGTLAPCVVKPVDGNLSRGVTVDVDQRNFKQAWERAREHTNSGILIERYFRGREARYLVVDNRCVAVLQETPPFVTGDGKHSIAELVAAKNAVRSRNPYLRHYPITLDDAKSAYLAQRGLDFATVVQEGIQIVLNDTDLFDGGDTVDITDHADQGLKRIAENITRYLPGLDVIGFDVMALDHAAPDGGGDFIFLEGNTRPDILEHHFPAFGSARNVARDIASSCSRRLSISPAEELGSAGKYRARDPEGRSPEHSGRVPCPADAILNPHRDLARRFTSRGFSASRLGSFLLIEKGEQRALFDGTDSSFTSRLGAGVLRDRMLARKLLRDAGISVPDTRIVGRKQKEEARAVVSAMEVAVLRSADARDGGGSSWKATEATFNAVWHEACERIDGDILVEQCFGPAASVRYILVDGLFQAAISRNPRRAAGFAQSTHLTIPRSETRKALQGIDRLSAASIPETARALGEEISRPVEGLSGQMEGFTRVTEHVHPGFREIAERVCKVLPDLHCLEIEILAEDHSILPSPENHVVAAISGWPDPKSALDPSFSELADINDALVRSCLKRIETLEVWPQAAKLEEPSIMQACGSAADSWHPAAAHPDLAAGSLADALEHECWVPACRPLPVLGLDARESGNTFQLVFTGDFAFGESYQESYERKGRGNILKSRGYQACLEGVRPLLRRADLVVANLETPLTRQRVSPLAGTKTWIHRGDPEATLRHLQGHNFGVLSIANNHSLDFGLAGLEATRAALQGGGYTVIGGGPDLDAASEPVLVEIRLGDSQFEIALIAAHDEGADGDRWPEAYAGVSRGGVSPLDPEVVAAQIERVRKERPGCLTIVLPHWGRNYRWRTNRQRVMARALINAGADMIIGHGSHMLQEIEQVDGKWVVFSLGNFVFNSLGRYEKFSAPPYSIAARLVLSRESNGCGLRPSLQILPLVTDNRVTDYTTRPVSEAEFRHVMGILADRVEWMRSLSGSATAQDPEGHWYFELSI